MVGWRTRPPSGSHLRCLCQCRSVFEFHAWVADSCLDLGMPEKDLHGGQIAYLLVDQGCLCAPERVGAVILAPPLLWRKWNRLSRNVAFLLTLRDSGAKLVAADNPDVNDTTVGILAVIAEEKRKAIASRTTAAPQAAKKRGVRLGNPQRRCRAPTRCKGQRSRLWVVTESLTVMLETWPRSAPEGL